MSMKDAMGRLKQQALEFSVKAQKSAEAAAADRAAAAAELDRINGELAAAKGEVRILSIMILQAPICLNFIFPCRPS